MTGPRKSSTRPRPTDVCITRGGGRHNRSFAAAVGATVGAESSRSKWPQDKCATFTLFFLLPLILVVALHNEVCEEPNTTAIVDSRVHRRFMVTVGSSQLAGLH